MNRVLIFSADLCRAGLALISGLLLLVCGCGASTKSAPAGAGGGSGETGVSFSGKVMAGSQPVGGAAVQLYAAGKYGLWIGGHGVADWRANDQQCRRIYGAGGIYVS